MQSICLRREDSLFILGRGAGSKAVYMYRIRRSSVPYVTVRVEICPGVCERETWRTPLGESSY